MTNFTMGDFTEPGPEDWKRIRDEDIARGKAERTAREIAREAHELMQAEGRRQREADHRWQMECLVDEALGASGCNLSHSQREFMVEFADSLRRAWFPEPTYDRNWNNTAKPRGR